MSIPAYVSFGLAIIIVLFTYLLNKDLKFLLTAMPMLLVLLGVPMILNEMNRRHMDKIDIRSFKFYSIKDLTVIETGDPVRIRGTVEEISLKWLNRPNFQINDESGRIGVFMFWAPREDIKLGDRIEVAGSLRMSGLAKKKGRLWGIKIEKTGREKSKILIN
jgi:hypothetical protein